MTGVYTANFLSKSLESSSRFAFNPAMSAEVERLFSSYKITITDRRNRIGIDAVEAIECLKSWLRENNVAWVDEEWIDRWVAVVEAETQKEGKGRSNVNIL